MLDNLQRIQVFMSYEERRIVPRECQYEDLSALWKEHGPYIGRACIVNRLSSSCRLMRALLLCRAMDAS